MTKASELRDQPDDDLLARLEAAKEELFNLRFQFATGQLDNPMRIKAVRHDVARLLTILRERQSEYDLERAIARADEQALAESREAQARGEKKGVSLAEMGQQTAIEQEAAMGAEALPPEEEQR
jgi:large subunit ribosomal protein L29